MSVNIEKAPTFVRELLANEATVTKLAVAFPEIESVILEAQRNIVAIAPGKEGEMVVAIDHLLKHFRLFRDVGNDVIAKRESDKKEGE